MISPMTDGRDCPLPSAARSHPARRRQALAVPYGDDPFRHVHLYPGLSRPDCLASLDRTGAAASMLAPMDEGNIAAGSAQDISQMSFEAGAGPRSNRSCSSWNAEMCRSTSRSAFTNAARHCGLPASSGSTRRRRGSRRSSPAPMDRQAARAARRGWLSRCLRGVETNILGEGLKRVQGEIDSLFDALLPVPDDTSARPDRGDALCRDRRGQAGAPAVGRGAPRACSAYRAIAALARGRGRSRRSTSIR